MTVAELLEVLKGWKPDCPVWIELPPEDGVREVDGVTIGGVDVPILGFTIDGDGLHLQAGDPELPPEFTEHCCRPVMVEVASGKLLDPLAPVLDARAGLLPDEFVCAVCKVARQKREPGDWGRTWVCRPCLGTPAP